MYRTIAVPLDGSKLAESALPAAIHIARRCTATLELITIEIPHPLAESGTGPWVDTTWQTALQDARLTYLLEVSRRVATESRLQTKHTVKSGSGRGVEALLEHVRTAGIDLIVLATHGYGPIKQFWLGSFADSLVRQSPIPTLLVRHASQADTLLTAEPEFQRVLIALDGSVAAASVIEHAVAVSDIGAEYTLFSTIAPVIAHAPEYSLLPSAMSDAVVQTRFADAKKYLEGVADSLRQRNLRVQAVVSTAAFAAQAILDHAEKNRIDLIALTTHGHGGARRLLLGSVADKVVRGACCPVLLYRPAQS